MSLDKTIRNVQTALGVAADGQAGPQTWTAIHAQVVGKKPAAGAGLDTIIRAVQKKLGVAVDGNPGPQTWGAIHEAVTGKKAPATPKPSNAGADPLTGNGQMADSRSEKNIATLHLRVRPYARALVESARKQQILIKVTSGLRSYEEQEKLYKAHLAGGPQAAPPGKSNHNFGLAFDITLFKWNDDPELAKTPVWESPLYKVVGSLGMGLGLEWGGSWKSSVDEPHFQLRPAWAAKMTEPAMLAELRKRKDAGTDYYA